MLLVTLLGGGRCSIIRGVGMRRWAVLRTHPELRMRLIFQRQHNVFDQFQRD